jgi:hypothetical protein
MSELIIEPDSTSGENKKKMIALHKKRNTIAKFPPKGIS